MQISNRPRRLVKPFGQSAGSGYIRQVPVAASTGGAASYETGFPPENFQPVASGGVPPSGQDMNGVLYDTTGAAVWMAAGGSASFDSATATAIGGYPRLAQLTSLTTGVVWQSTVDNNLTDPDSSSAAGWTAVSGPYGSYADHYTLPNGKLEQWGENTTVASTEIVVDVTLPTPFASNVYNLSVTPVLATATNYGDIWLQIIRNTKTATGFSVQYQLISTPTGQYHIDGFEWRAVGVAPTTAPTPS